MKKDRHHIIPAVFVMLLDQNKIFLFKRQNTGWHDGEYDLPSGHIEPGETAVQAAVRETLEEAAVKIKIEDLKLAHTLFRKSEDGEERADFLFITEKWQGQPKVNEPHKASGGEWFSLDALPLDLIKYDRQAVECWRKDQNYSEFGW